MPEISMNEPKDSETGLPDISQLVTINGTEIPEFGSDPVKESAPNKSDFPDISQLVAITEQDAEKVVNSSSVGSDIYKQFIRQGASATELIAREMIQADQRLVGLGAGTQRAIQGIQQLYLENFSDPETLRNFNELTMKERALWDKSPYGESFHGQLGQFAGEALPWVYITSKLPGVSGSGPSGFLMRAGYSGTVGGATAYSSFVNDNESRLSNLYKGAAYGIAGQSAFDAVLRVPKFLAQRYLKSAMESDRYKEGQELIDHFKSKYNEDINLDLFQMSGMPSSRAAMLAETKDVIGADRFISRANEAIDKYRNAYSKLLSKYGVDGISRREITNKLSVGYTTAVENMKQARNIKWEETLNKLPKNEKIKESIPVENLAKHLDEQISDIEGGKLIANEIKSLLPVLKRLRHDIGKSGKISLNTLQRAVKDFGKLAYPASIPSSLSGESKMYAYKGIYKNLVKDLDSAADNADLGQLANTLKIARTEWKADQLAIDNITMSTLGKIFGKDIGKLDIDKVSTKIKKLNTEDIKLATKMFDNVDPQIMKDVRAFVLKDAWDAARVRVKESGLPEIDINKFIKELPDEKTILSLYKGESTRNDIINAVKMANRLSVRLEATAKSPIEAVQNIASVSASHDPTFLSLYAAKFMGPKFFKQLATNEGREALNVLLSSKSQHEIAAALAVLGEQTEDIIPLKPKDDTK